MLQVYQVCHQLSPWYIICMTQGLRSHAPSVPGLSSTITLVHYMYDPGPWSHAPSVPGPSLTITLVHYELSDLWHCHSKVFNPSLGGLIWRWDIRPYEQIVPSPNPYPSFRFNV